MEPSLEALFKFYIDLLSGLTLIIAPISLVFAAYTWVFVWRYRKYRLGLPIVMAVVNTIAAVSALWFGVRAWDRLSGGPVLVWAPPVSATFFVILDLIPLLTTGYLIWLDRRRGRAARRKHELQPKDAGESRTILG